MLMNGSRIISEVSDARTTRLIVFLSSAKDERFERGVRKGPMKPSEPSALNCKLKVGCKAGWKLYVKRGFCEPAGEALSVPFQFQQHLTPEGLNYRSTHFSAFVLLWKPRRIGHSLDDRSLHSVLVTSRSCASQFPQPSSSVSTDQITPRTRLRQPEHVPSSQNCPSHVPMASSPKPPVNRLAPFAKQCKGNFPRL